MGCLLTQAVEMRLEKEGPGDARGSRSGQRLKGRILPAPTMLSNGNTAPNGPIMAPRQGQARHSGDGSHVNRHLPPDGDVNGSPCSRRTRAHDGAVTSWGGGHTSPGQGLAFTNSSNIPGRRLRVMHRVGNVSHYNYDSFVTQ